MSESEIKQIKAQLSVIRTGLANILEGLNGIAKEQPEPEFTTPVTPMTQNIEDAKSLFPTDLEELLEFNTKGKNVIIRPRQYLGSENFSKIASIVREAGGEYISAGKESHFKL